MKEEEERIQLYRYQYQQPIAYMCSSLQLAELDSLQTLQILCKNSFFARLPPVTNTVASSGCVLSQLVYDQNGKRTRAEAMQSGQ